MPVLIRIIHHNKVDYNIDFLKNILSRIEWHVLVAAAKTVRFISTLNNKANIANFIEEVPSDTTSDSAEPFFQSLHHCLLEVHYTIT